MSAEFMKDPIKRKMYCFICKTELNKNHNHYGSNSVCHSCRAFFMRSVKDAKFRNFQHELGKCVIDSKSRKSCRKCRFDACLKAGMIVSYVKHQNSEKSSASNNLNQELKQVKMLTNTLKIEEEHFLNNLHDTVKRTETRTTFDTYVKNIYLICPQVFNSKYVHTNKDIEVMSRLNKFINKQMVHTLGKTSNTDDINELFEHNYGRLRVFKYAILFSDEQIMLEYANELIEHAIKDNTVYEDAKNVFIQIVKSPKMSRSSYESFFNSPWANSAEIEIEHLKLYRVNLFFNDQTTQYFQNELDLVKKNLPTQRNICDFSTKFQQSKWKITQYFVAF